MKINKNCFIKIPCQLVYKMDRGLIKTKKNNNLHKLEKIETIKILNKVAIVSKKTLRKKSIKY